MIQLPPNTTLFSAENFLLQQKVSRNLPDYKSVNSAVIVYEVMLYGYYSEMLCDIIHNSI